MCVSVPPCVFHTHQGKAKNMRKGWFVRKVKNPESFIPVHPLSDVFHYVGVVFCIYFWNLFAYVGTCTVYLCQMARNNLVVEGRGALFYQVAAA